MRVEETRSFCVATVDLPFPCVAFNLFIALIMQWKSWVGRVNFYKTLIDFSLSPYT
jgi:hypothetical protein